MVRALSTAQTQSVREINKNADIKKTNKKISVIVVTILVLIIVAYIAYKGYSYYMDNRFDFSEKEMGITFYSKDMTVRDAIATVMDNNKVVISANTIQDDFNNLSDTTQSVVLLTTMLTAKNKEVTVVVNVINSNGNLVYCSTNYGDIMVSTDINKAECLSIVNNAEALITIAIPNPKLKESRVNLYPLDKRLDIIPKTQNDQLISTYLSLKSNYPELEKVLSKIEAIKDKLSDLQNSGDLNLTQDTNTSDLNTIDDNNTIDSNN